MCQMNSSLVIVSDAGSNRSRVIALSKELAALLPRGCKILCVADRDHEDYLPSVTGTLILNSQIIHRQIYTYGKSEPCRN